LKPNFLYVSNLIIEFCILYILSHTNICGSDISASCLDDRKRKIILGDVNGHIKVFNCSNGQYMKGCNYHTHAAVVSLQYYDEAKRFLAGFANGVVGIFDENEMEECILIRCLDAKSQHSELRSMCLNQESKQILTVGGKEALSYSHVRF
jgi:WD40 repeat protein